jgi:hypothetical protein
LAALTAAPARALDPARGYLLYQNFCYHCHISEIHHRVNSRSDSWEELMRLVQMWQAEMGLGWSEEDVQDVALWLDWRFYRLPDAPGPH